METEVLMERIGKRKGQEVKGLKAICYKGELVTLIRREIEREEIE